MNANVPPPSWPDWPAHGEVPPAPSTRVERKAKELLRRARRVPRGPAPASGFDLERVYRLTGSPRGPAATAAVRDAFRAAVEPAQAIDATFAALAIALAGRDRARGEGLLAFLELCYESADLDAGAARMGGHLRASGASNPVLARLDYEASWPALAAGVRKQIRSMPPRAARPDRRLALELAPRRVVLRMSGGLGNQLFQYAAALAYARRAGAKLRLDLANYEGRGRDREFLLGRLRIPIRRANSYEILATRLRPHLETLGAFDEFMFGDHGSAWLGGFWEDPAYFADILPTLRRRFRPRDGSLARAAGELVHRARQQDGPVIGVHLRRGDRGPGGRHFSPFSTLPASYYRQAASRFPAGSNFLVFSDTPEDIAWSRDHLGLGEPATVSFGEGSDPILDMFALARCDHVILSAGTFSWWAAYLGDRAGRRVLAPNPLQARSAAMVMVPSPMPLQPGWEQITFPPVSAG